MLVQRYLAWAGNAPVRERAAAVEKLSRAWLYTEMDVHDREGCEVVLTLSLDDEAPAVRMAIAKVLGACKEAPRHIVTRLARDLPDISRIVLANSPILSPSDLIQLVQSGEATAPEAIATRMPLTVELAQAIAEHGNAAACAALCRNKSVILSGSIHHLMAERFGDDPMLREIILEDEGLAPGTRQLLVQKLVSSLASLVSEKKWLSQARARSSASDAGYRAVLDIAAGVSSNDMPDFVQHLQRNGQLTLAFLIRAVCAGHAVLFEAALSHLTGAPRGRVSGIISEGRESAFRALYGRSGLPADALPVFTSAIAVWREEARHADADSQSDGTRLARKVMRRIMSLVGEERITNGSILSLLDRLEAECERDAAYNFSTQLRLAA